MEWLELIPELVKELDYGPWDWVRLGASLLNFAIGAACLPGLVFMMHRRQRLPDWRPLVAALTLGSLAVFDQSETFVAGPGFWLVAWSVQTGGLLVAFWWWWEERRRWQWGRRELTVVLLIGLFTVGETAALMAALNAEDSVLLEPALWFSAWTMDGITELERYDRTLAGLLAAPTEEAEYRILMLLVPLAWFDRRGRTFPGGRREKILELTLVLLGAALFMLGHDDRGAWLNFKLFASGALFGAGALRFGPLAPMLWHYVWNGTVSLFTLAFL